MNFLKSTFATIKSITLAILLICLVIFMVNNRETIAISLYPLPFEIETKVFLVMLSFFVFGMLFGILTCSQSLISKIVTGFKDKRKIKKLEKQIGR